MLETNGEIAIRQGAEVESADSSGPWYKYNDFVRGASNQFNY